MFYIPNSSLENTNNSSNTNVRTRPKSSSYHHESELEILYEKDLNFIKEYALYQSLRFSNVRSVYWRIFLKVLPLSSSMWQEIVRDLRSQYSTIKRDLTVDPHKSPSGLPNDNPLSQDADSVWYRYFCDTELKRVIKQDVIRTSPELQFFQFPHIQEIMVNILFIYARKNPTICYRQGMHEILALLLFVIHEDCDRFDNSEAIKQNSEFGLILTEILNEKYLEHDLYFLFAAIMKRMEKFYGNDYSSVPNACGHFPSSVSKNSTNINSNIKVTCKEEKESGIILLINSVIRNNLAVNDSTLYFHLKKLNLPYTAFGIRWLRLLFGREFPLNDLFVLWDAIFAVDCDFVLVNHTFVAMVIAIRDELINHDYVQCLNNLMNYPKTVDVSTIVKLALHLKDPKAYEKPDLLTIRKCESDKTLITSDTHKVKANSSQNLSKSLTYAQNKMKNIRWNVSKKTNFTNDCQKIPHAYLSKNQEKLITELKHMQVVMSLCKLKLRQYHDILTASINDDDAEAQHALMGIQELCTLLEIDHFSLESSPNNDISEKIATPKDADPTPFHSNDVSSSHATEDTVSTYLPPPKTDIDMTTFKCSEHSLADTSNFPSKCPHKVKNK